MNAVSTLVAALDAYVLDVRHDEEKITRERHQAVVAAIYSAAPLLADATAIPKDLAIAMTGFKSWIVWQLGSWISAEREQS